MKILPLSIMLLALTACGTDAPLSERILGTWHMETVMHNEIDVTDEHDPNDTRYITFNADGSFTSGGYPLGTNTGTWIIDAASSELFIDSDAGEDDDSYWFVTIDGGTMVWKGSRDFAREFVLTHKKKRV